MDKTLIDALLERSAAKHSHLCPRQVLGVRIGIAGARALELALPRHDKRMLAILETDGCFADGIEAATGLSVGHRTLRVEDYGKVAAVFIDVKTDQAVRVAPRLDIRERAWEWAEGETKKYYAQLKAYQVMPDEELLSLQAVFLRRPAVELVSRAGVRVNCSVCGEEVINEREVYLDGKPVCQACTGQAYYIQQPIILHPHLSESCLD